MKIRNGFVSNSSSSSFILKYTTEFPDTITIAESMLKDKYGEYDCVDNYSHIFNRLEKLSQIDVKSPIFFNSCNYDTYIVPLDDEYVFIDTCNNTDWSVKHSNALVSNFPEGVRVKHPKSESYGTFENYIYTNDENEFGEPCELKDKMLYYLVEHNIFLKPDISGKSCDKCYEYKWCFKGEPICVKCDWDKINRLGKILKIKSKINGRH